MRATPENTPPLQSLSIVYKSRSRLLTKVWEYFDVTRLSYRKHEFRLNKGYKCLCTNAELLTLN